MSGHPTPKLVAVDVILINYTMFRQVPEFFFRHAYAFKA